MRTFLFALLGISTALGAGAPLSSSTNLAVVVLNSAAETQITYRATVANQAFPWAVGTQLIPSMGVEFLESGRLNPFFAVDEVVGDSKRRFVNGDGDNRIPFTLYLARYDNQTGIWTFYDGGLKVGAGSRTDVYFAFRLSIEESVNYGWIRFTRPDAQPETLFTVAGHDWNPIPGAPIQVGRPPEVPIGTQVLSGGGGIQLTWPAGASQWVLESTRSLTPPIVWEPYPSGGSYADVPPDDADRYFRLRRPE